MRTQASRTMNGGEGGGRLKIGTAAGPENAHTLRAADARAGGKMEGEAEG